MEETNANKTKPKRKMSSKAQTLTFVALSTAITCILGPLSIPIGPVPISLTILAIFISV